MEKILNLLLYGGVTPKMYRAVAGDVNEGNRKSVISYSAISIAGFLAVWLYAATGSTPVSQNASAYLIGILVMLILLVSNLTIARKKPAVTTVSSFIFVIVLLGIGIMLAASSRQDVTASYMVFLFVAPLLVTLRPLQINLVVLSSDVFYVLLMMQIQASEIFRKNIVNACIYGFFSMFVCTTMTRMRMQKYETDYKNRILMGTDQLTGMLNRRSFMQHIDKLKGQGGMAGIKICAFDVNGLKKVNDRIGHHAGDELLRGAAACLENVFSHYGHCYRVGGDEFMAILQGASPSIKELQKLLDDQTLSYKGTYVPGLSIASGIVEGTEQDDIDSLLRKADTLMYENKAAYYQQSGIPHQPMDCGEA